MLKKCLFILVLFHASICFSQTHQPHPHPFYYTADKIATAHANIEKYDWAKALWKDIRQSADEAASQTDDVLRQWFSEYTPISQCDCPYCGHYWLDYVWDWSPENPDQVQCRYCDEITSLNHFHENDAFNVIDPQGVLHPHPVYRDSTGKVFPIRELIYFHKEKYAYDWIKNLGLAFALTKDEKYASKALVLLNRLSEVYPGFGIHDNFRFERYAFGWAGKLRMWHYTDAYTLQDCAAAYDALYNSESISAVDKAFIETNLFKTAVDFLISVKPSQGISNDMAFRYSGVAMLGRTLEDHDAIRWVMEEEEGYLAFVNKLFYKDGTWHERSPGYHNMAAKPLHETAEILDGYSDPMTYQNEDRYDDINLKGTKKLKNIFSVMLDMRFPNKTLPPVNDGAFGSKPDPTPLEALYVWSGDISWLEKANQAYEGEMLKRGGLYSLFNRPPDTDTLLKQIGSEVKTPDLSDDFTGMGLFMLRRGSGENQTVFTLHHHKYSSAHTHYDALSTILFAEGREMLSDFGYPSFSSPLRMTWYLKTLSHNTLSVDTNNQYAPNGVANWIHHGKMFSACEAEAWESYRFICEPFFRQIALVDAEDGQVYAVDIFRGDGGSVHDWALHGESDSLAVKELTMSPMNEMPGNDSAYDMLTNIQRGITSDPWMAEWVWDDAAALTCYFPGQSNCEIYKAKTPGERTKKMKGRQKYSVFNRRQGSHVRSEFAGIYEPNRGDKVVKSVETIQVSPYRDWVVVIKVTLKNSVHYILTSYLDLSPQQKPFTDGKLSIPWKSRFGIVEVKKGKIVNQEWVKGVMEGLRHDM